MIVSIGSSYPGIAAQTAAKRDRGSAFGSIMATAEASPVAGTPTPQRTLQTGQDIDATKGKAVDFTRMTRSELRELVNSKIKSGELSIDGTEGFVVMMGPSDAEQAGQADNTAIDFIKSVSDQMEFARQHGNSAWLSRLQTALGTMQRYQDQAGSVSLLG